MVLISHVQASNAALDDTTVPRVSVFVGATAGIGKSALTELLTSAEGHGAMKVYVVGRGSKQERQVTLLDPLQALNPEAELIWVQGDVALLADVKRICEAIKGKESSLDLLYLSAGFAPWEENHRTSEGMRTASSLMFYSRMAFMYQLLPLLRVSPHGRVVSIAAGGFENDTIDLVDFDFEKPGAFGPMALQRQMANMMAVCMDQLAEENPGITFIHQHPGVVKTGNGLKDLSSERWVTRYFMTFFISLAWLIMGLSPKESGERTSYLMTSAQYGGVGAPLQDGVEAGATGSGTQQGALFCVSRINDPVVKPELWATLRKDYRPAVLKNLKDKLAPYM